MTRKHTLMTIQDATLKLAEAQLTFLAHDSLACNSYPFYPTPSPRKKGFSKDSLAIWKTRLTPMASALYHGESSPTPPAHACAFSHQSQD